MLNLLGDVWRKGDPNWRSVFEAIPQARLFLYGKQASSPRRKMGHILIQNAVSSDAALDTAMLVHRLLSEQ
jgi:5-(carboxyamino)imidazole ribonucleotide synthase